MFRALSEELMSLARVAVYYYAGDLSDLYDFFFRSLVWRNDNRIYPCLASDILSCF